MKNVRIAALAAAILAAGTGGYAVAQTTPGTAPTAPPMPAPAAPGSPQNPKGASPGGVTNPNSGVAPSPSPSPSGTPS